MTNCSHPALSLVVPCRNEAENIPIFMERVLACMETPDAPPTCELIFVDDGSTDDTFAKIFELTQSSFPRMTVSGIEFSRNFGKESALLAGLEHARGSLVGFIDADMQQDPAISFSMFTFLRQHDEYDCVAAVQEQRQEGAVLKWFKKRFYRTFNAVGDIEIPANASDFRVFRRPVAEALLSMPEYFRFSKGLFAWVGFKTATIIYKPQARHAGTSSWSFRSLMSYALGGIVSFSTWPLRLVLYTGLLTSFISVIYLLIVLFEYLFVGIYVPGYPTIVCLILLFCGIVMLALGIFGEYLGRIYIEGKHRPAYIARQIVEGAPAVSADAACVPEAKDGEGGGSDGTGSAGVVSVADASDDAGAQGEGGVARVS